MTVQEQGLLLLTSCLGDPARHPLTMAQFRELTRKMRASDRPLQERDLTEEDLRSFGCDGVLARRILGLLSQTQLLKRYAENGAKLGCIPITRISAAYPDRLRKTLGLDAPGVLWARGDFSVLGTPMIALVGSRDLGDKNREFAYEVGKQAALQGYSLVSGNARGADRIAQESCLAHGGRVLSVVADTLYKLPQKSNLLYLSEDGYDQPFSAHRALQRNRVIHSLGDKTFVAQCGFGKGGTWNGTTVNLQKSQSSVFCFRDGSQASRELAQRGAVLITADELRDISGLRTNILNFIDQ